MPSKQRRAERTAGIARGRLNPDAVENAVAQNTSVRDAVERDSAGQTKISLSGFLANVPRHPQYDFVDYILDRASQVHVALGQPRFRFTWRSVEQAVKRNVRHGQADTGIKRFDVESERPVVFEIDHLAQNYIAIFWLAVRREPHQFVFAGIDFEPGEISERGVK